ncbi:MAG: CHAT domain-containing protein [Chloroflexota bacterium]
MSQTSTFADLEVRILEQHDEGYPVEITLNYQQEFPRGYLNPDFLPWTSGASPEEDGLRLFDWLLTDDTLKTAWAEAKGQYPQRRIRFRVDAEAPELHAIPWELLREGHEAVSQDVASSASTPFSRYLAGKWSPGSPVLQRPIKMLVAIANPDNLMEDYELSQIDIEEEMAMLEEATDSLEVELTELPQPCTLSALETALKDGYHVLHFIGHGMFSKRNKEARLYLADDDNKVNLVNESDFAAMLSRQLVDTEDESDNALRLVFLASCQTATRSSSDAFRGFAPALVNVGVPAVMAMQDLVPIETARAFSQTFYQQVLKHGQVDLASNEARSALMTGDLPGAAIPVLFMRLRSGRLFGVRGQILGDRAESFWETLLNNIADGECTPFLGPRVTLDLLPSLGDISNSLATEYHYPFPDRDNLAKVAQFVGTLDNRNLRKKVSTEMISGFKERIGEKFDRRKDRRKTIGQVIEEADWANRGREIMESDIHQQLADLELPLYITTNFDNFMFQALKSKAGEARQSVVDWRESVSQDASRPHHDLDPPPDYDNPVVLHLFGTDDDLLSMVLTEDDYLDYLAKLSRDYEYLLPTSVNAALASTTLLFLGLRLDDIALKVIMRGLLTNLDLERWGMLHVAVQIEDPSDDEADQQEVIRFFQRYFSDAQIDIYWGSTQQFVADLHARWQEFDA